MAVEFCVISIGTLSHNHLWGESAPVRTSHATTTLVTDGTRRIIVDPSLPPAAIAARLNERTGKDVSEVTDVFVTNLRPTHRRGIELFDTARWWANQAEIDYYGAYLQGLLESTERLDASQTDLVHNEMELLKRFEAAPDKFTEQVHLYPLAGPSAGGAGLLLSPATRTIIIAGDAAITAQHVQRGMVWEGCQDTQLAMESLRDLLEVADIIVPGHDNFMLAPRESWM